MNRLWLTIGLALMDVCWIYPWAVLVGVWSDPSRATPLLSPVGVFGVLLLGALSTQALGRRAAAHRSARLGLAVLGVLVCLIVVRQDQYPGTGGLEWLGLIVGALAVFLGQPTGPAVAFALGLFLWWRGVRLGRQMPTYSDVESRFRWGIGLLVFVALLMAIATRPSVLQAIEAQTTPFVVGFFFVSLITLALGRLESLRSRTRALALNTQWLGVLIGVAGGVVLVALIVGQLVSFDLLILATRPLFDLLGQVLIFAIYLVVIPLAFVVEWLIYLLLNLLHAAPNQQPPQPLQPSEVDNLLQRILSQTISPELLQALKAGGAVVLLLAVVLIVARAASRWRASSADADATAEERDSLWEPGRLRRALVAWLKKLLRRDARVAAQASAAPDALAANGERVALASVREVYRQMLWLGGSAGARRPAAATPLEHLPALQQALVPEDDVADVTQAYLSVRYAEIEASPAEVVRLRDRLDQLRPRAEIESTPADD